MVSLMLAAIAGMTVTAVLLSPFGLFTGLLLAPVGGSLAALAVGIYRAARASRETEATGALQTPSDTQVSTLKQILQGSEASTATTLTNGGIHAA